MDAFSSVWKFIKDGFNNLKDTLGGIVKGIANAIVKPIGGAVNGVIHGVNWVLDKVGSDKQFALWEVPKFARGTGGIPKDTLGIVNDQKGSTYKEMIVPPHGKPFIPEGRDVVLPLEKGTKIMPANQTKSFLEELPHFASGIGDFFGGIWSTVKDFTGNVWDYITHPSKIVQIAIDKFTDLTGAFEPWISVAKGAVNTVFDSVVGFVKGIFDTQSHVNYNPSAGVEQWRTLATRALQMTGQYSEANLERLLYQMQTESVEIRMRLTTGISMRLMGRHPRDLCRSLTRHLEPMQCPDTIKTSTIHYLICLHPFDTQCLRTEALRLLIVELGTRMVLEISICPIYYQVCRCWM